MQKEGLALTEKKKAILLTKEEHNAERVYAGRVMSKLNDRYDLYETVICKNNIKKHLSACKNAEYIFSTGGMEPFSEDDITEFFPNA